jgi:hypothetical protein
VTKQIGGVEEQAAIQLMTSMWLGQEVMENGLFRGRGDKRCFWDHVNWKGVMRKVS